MDHIRTVLCVAYRIFRDISLHVAQLQVVACIQHTAVSIAAALDQIVLRLLGSCYEHLRAVEMLRQQCLGNLRTEVAQIYAECVTSVVFNVLQSVHHINLALDDADRTLIDVGRIIFCLICFYQGFSSVHCKRCRETVTAYSYNTNFDFR